MKRKTNNEAAKKNIARTLAEMKYFVEWEEDAAYVIRRLAKAGLRIVEHSPANQKVKSCPT